jgi:TonB family protein
VRIDRIGEPGEIIDPANRCELIGHFLFLVGVNVLGALLKLKSVAFCLSVLCTHGLMAKQDPSQLEAGKTSQAASAAQAQKPHRVRVKEDVQKAKLVHMVFPVYPPLSEKRVDGTVVLRVVIRKSGAVKSARYVSGPTNLMKSATDAVLQWRYKPTLMNGVPVEVDTTVTLVFPPT